MLLSHLARTQKWQQALVFSRTKHGANKLVRLLENDGIRAAAIHGNKSQNQRTKALADFKEGKIELLIATDIAARGIDIQQLPLVVNYDLPNVPADYVHRIGRTGRAGSEGHAISLVTEGSDGHGSDCSVQGGALSVSSAFCAWAAATHAILSEGSAVQNHPVPHAQCAAE